MVQRIQLGVGPLTAAAARIAGVVPAAPVAGDPAAFLARLIDLRSSVELSHRIGAPGRLQTAPDPGARGRLRGLAGERLDAVRGDVERTFAEPFQRRNKLPAEGEVHAALERAGALTERRGRALTDAAEVVWAPFGELVTRALDRVRFEIAALREEIGPEVAALGPAAARLERLDAALLGATVKGRQQIEDRLLPALARSFAARFRAAVDALPEPAAPAHLRPWFAPAGFLRAEMLLGREVVLAVLAHERRRIEALVEVEGALP